MKRNCNLELRLLPPSNSFINNSNNNYTQHHFSLEMLKNGSSSSSSIMQQEQHKQMTIFYNGQMAVTHLTELQARAIILDASRSSTNKYSSSPRSPLMQQQQLHSPSPSPSGLSMKRSLQRFLQKRKTRAQAASSYYHH